MIKLHVKRKDEDGKDIVADSLASIIAYAIAFALNVFLYTFALYSIWNLVFIDFITFIKPIDMFQALSILFFGRLMITRFI